MRNNFSSSIFYVFLLFSSCIGEEGFDNSFPQVVTEKVSNITPLGARFSARINSQKSAAITQYGFIWGTSSTLTDNVKTIEVDTANTTEINAYIGSDLVAGKLYYVRAFIKTTKIVYGNIVSFRSLGSEGPVITSLSKETAAVGDTVEVVGRNFSAGAGINLFYENVDITKSILSTNATLVKFILPYTVYPPQGIITISVEGNVSHSPKPLVLDIAGSTPMILSILPKAIHACDTFKIIGKNLKFANSDTYVYLGNQLNVIHATRDTLFCVMSHMPSSQPNLAVFNGLFISTNFSDFTILSPEVVSLSSSIYRLGDVVTISVKNFPYCDTGIQAWIDNGGFGSTQLLSITSSTASEVKVKIDQCYGLLKISFGFQNPFDYSFKPFCTSSLLTPYIGQIYSVEPSHASLGDEVIIKGKDLGQYGVDFLNVTSSTDTEIRGTVIESNAPNGTIDVNVWDCGGPAVLKDGFTYNPPEILEISPSSITSAAQMITITGKNLSGANYGNIVRAGTATYTTYDSTETITLPATFFLADGSLTMHEDVYVTIENGTGMNSSPYLLRVDHDASWFQINNFNGPHFTYGVSFAIDGKGYAGVGYSSNYPDKSFWEYDPSTDIWKKKTSYPGGLGGGTTVGISANGKGYVGMNQYFDKQWFEYDPGLDKWTRKKDFPGGSTFPLLSMEINGKIYVGGGIGDSPFEFWEYDPMTNEWTQKAQLPAYGYNGSASFGFKGKGYLYGSPDGVAFWEYAYDPGIDLWSKRAIASATLPDIKSLVFNDYVILAGGATGLPDSHNLIYKVIPGSSDLEPVDFAGSAMYYQKGFAIGDYGYFGLGQNLNSNLFGEMWKFDPSKF